MRSRERRNTRARFCIRLCRNVCKLSSKLTELYRYKNSNCCSSFDNWVKCWKQFGIKTHVLNCSVLIRWNPQTKNIFRIRRCSRLLLQTWTKTTLRKSSSRWFRNSLKLSRNETWTLLFPGSDGLKTRNYCFFKKTLSQISSQSIRACRVQSSRPKSEFLAQRPESS